MKWIGLGAIIICLIACTKGQTAASDSAPILSQDTTIYTEYSQLDNLYEGFHSPNAINQIADIENTHFRQYKDRVSPYYGTEWRTYMEGDFALDSVTNSYQLYLNRLGQQADSMHCTIYAVKALEAGMGSARFAELEASHQRIWGSREHAGWSIGHLLVKEWGWKAYLILDSTSNEFDHASCSFRRHQSYPVWRQPDIPLEQRLILGKDDSTIATLLNQHEFGWGFSEQGIHTWITRFDVLKECNWLGAPNKAFAFNALPLFLKTPFLEYRDYASHVVIFPPKRI